ncbi:recombinase family protein [Chloroflexota bacterium]
MAKLIEDTRKRKFQAVLVWALDRLSREGALAILSLVQKLSVHGVKVLSYQESWTEVPGEMAELLYALTGWVARMESQRRSEWTKSGFARVKARGKRLGRPPGSRDNKEEEQTVMVSRRLQPPFLEPISSNLCQRVQVLVSGKQKSKHKLVSCMIKSGNLK